MTQFARAVVVALCLAAQAAGALAAETDVGLEHYTVTRWAGDADAPATLVRGMAQGPEGFLWLGSGDGLFRFDGFTFDRWSSLSEAALAGRAVRVLYRDAGQRLWVGFDDGGISRIEGTRARNYGPTEGLTTPGIRVFFEERDGTLWAGGRGGLYRLDGDRWSQPAAAAGLGDEPVFGASLQPDGTLLVTTDDGVYRRPAGASVFEHLATVDADNGGVRDVCVDTAGRIITTDPIQGYRVLGDPPAATTALEQGIGADLLCGHDGTVWVGTAFAGLWRRPPPGAGPALAVDTNLLAEGAMSLLEDRDRNIWVATTRGLYRLTPRNLTTLSGFGIVATLAPDGQGGMWAGTFDGLFRFVPGGQGWTRSDRYLPGARIRALHTDDAGTTWVATNHGVFRIGRDGRLSSPPWGTPFRQIDSITSDARGTLWFYDVRQGLFCPEGDAAGAVPLPSELLGIPNTTIHHDVEGRLWMVNSQVVASRDATGAVRRYTTADGLGSGSYRSLFQDDGGTLWLGGAAGLSRLRGDRFDTVVIDSAYPAGSVNTIAEDRQGRFWLGTDRGGIRLTRAAFEQALGQPDRVMRAQFEVFDGLPGAVRAISDRAVARAGNGDLWFVTDEGIAVIAPGAAAPGRTDLVARVTAARAVDAAVALSDTTGFPPGTTRISIDYAAVDLTTPHRVHFQYRLDGFDEHWIDAGLRRTAEYTNLAPGAYLFRVRASRDGIGWTETATTWPFSVAPLFYQAAWFPWLVGLVCAGAGYGAWQLHLKQVRKRFSLVLAERTRVSRELHDTLLQSLVGLSLQCQALAGTTEAERVREAIIAMRRRIDVHVKEARDAIWRLRSPALRQEDLITALRRTAEETIAGAPVDFRLQVVGDQRPCPPAIERELLLVAREALSNAVRHARPRTIETRVAFDRGRLSLQVHDDGCGFTPPGTAEPPTVHCGLAVMRERIETLGGRFSLESVLREGTRISAAVPLEPLPGR